MKTTMSAMIAVVGLGLSSGSAQAASDLHIDELANRLEIQTAELTNDIQYNFHHSSSYRHLYKDALEMEALASHIHDLAHNFESRRHIADDVRKLDRLLHHVESLVDSMERRARRRAHNDCHLDYDDVKLADIRHIQRIMSRLSDTLHHLRDDLRPVRRSRRYRYRTTYPPRPYFQIRF